MNLIHITNYVKKMHSKYPIRSGIIYFLIFLLLGILLIEYKMYRAEKLIILLKSKSMDQSYSEEEAVK